MSTRCQVKIAEKGVAGATLLYHHCDGYPTNMIPLIAGAYKPEWKHGRFGKVVSFVVAEDPDGYEVEQGLDLHGDIEWYYVLEVKSEQHSAAIPEWFLTVYRCDGEDFSDFKKMFSGPIDMAVKLAEEIESGE